MSLNLVIGDHILDIGGTVVYLESLDETRCCMGIEFDDLDPEAEQLLGGHVGPIEVSGE